MLDIDKAVKIVRETEEEDEVVPNLMIGFGIDKEQGEYVAEIKLRQLNREHILKRTAEIGTLEEEIADLEDILNRPQRVRQIMIDELRRTAEKYGEERHTEILYDTGADEPEQDSAGDLPDYPVTVFFTREGYFKKITPASLRMSSDQKLKEGDAVRCAIETQNNAHLLFFTNRCQVYKCRAGEFEDTKASLLGDYIPARLGMEEGELPVYMAVTDDSYKGFLLFFFENGKVARVPLESYATKQNRRKLLAAYSDKSPLVTMEQLSDECELAIETSASRLLLVHTTQIAEKNHPLHRWGTGGYLKKECLYKTCAPGRSHGTGKSAPLPGAHPARCRRLTAQRGPGGTNFAVRQRLAFSKAFTRHIPLFQTAQQTKQKAPKRTMRLGAFYIFYFALLASQHSQGRWKNVFLPNFRFGQKPSPLNGFPFARFYAALKNAAFHFCPAGLFVGTFFALL